jgi:hypothetical protein
VRHKVAAPAGNEIRQPGLTREVSSLEELEIGTSPYDVIVASPQLQDETGLGLIDTGAQVSLVKRKSLKENIPKAKFKEIQVNIQGISGDDVHIKEGIMLQINDSEEMLFYIVESLPRNLDLILGQPWLIRNDYVMTCPNTILPFSESVIKVPTKERGVRFVDKQELLPGVYCGTSLSLCHKGYFQCLVVNMTPFPVTQLPFPRLEKPPTIKTGSRNFSLPHNAERIAKLNGNLRLNHIVEGADAIRAICAEFVDIFRLPGDRLSAKNAAIHYIPTPAVPKGRAITLKNYRLAEAHKQEVTDPSIRRTDDLKWNYGCSKSERNFIDCCFETF